MIARPTLLSCTLLITALLLVLTFQSGAQQAPLAGRNVNMVSGTKFPDGDPYLQRQNEVTLAVSSRNPQHLMGSANDYRTVDIPGTPDPFLESEAPTVADAWIGVFKSFDGGNSWVSRLLPGYPQDTSPEGIVSPIKGFTTGSDSVVRAGTSGMFYQGGIAFNRDTEAKGALFVARYIDNNNQENGDPIVYLDTKVIDFGTSGQFDDKMWVATDIPRIGAGVCRIRTTQHGQVVTQTFPAGNVYVVYAGFVGRSEVNTNSNIMFSRSTDCGASWSKPSKVTTASRVYQGATLAIDPRDGTLYVAWREIKATLSSGNGSKTKVEGINAIHIAKSTNQGLTFSNPVKVADINPFDLGTNACTIDCSQFRTRVFPTMTVDGAGRLYIAWSERGAGHDGGARIAIKTSTGGTTWKPEAYLVDLPPRPDGHQFMPSLTFAAGQLMLTYYDLQDDVALGEGFPTASNPFDEKIVSGRPFRHTLDVRVAQAEPGEAPLFRSTRASRYRYAAFRDRATGHIQLRQLEFNAPNYRLFDQGSKPFIGDYIDVAAENFVFKDGVWKWNTERSNTTVYHIAWADNRDVVPPPTPYDWTKYTAPGSNQGAQSLYDPTKTLTQCVPGNEGMRNQNVYTSRISQGLAVSVPGNSKPLGGGFQRAFVVSVKNTASRDLNNPDPLSLFKFFRLTIEKPLPAGTSASFQQFDSDDSVVVSIPAQSSVARSVYVASTNPDASVKIHVEEIDIHGVPVAGGLASTAILNPDILNPDILNPDILNPDILNPNIISAEVHNPDILNTVQVTSVLNPDILNPDILNPDILNPDILNPDILNPDILNPDILNPDILNPDILNPDILNPDILNPDILNPAILNAPNLANIKVKDLIFTVANRGNTTSVYTFNNSLKGTARKFAFQLLVYKNHLIPTSLNCAPGWQEVRQELIVNILNPDILNPDILNPDILNPDILNPDILNPSFMNATFPLGPGENAKVALRVIDLDTTDGEEVTINGNPIPDPPPPIPGQPPPPPLVVPIQTVLVGDAQVNAAIVAADVNSEDAAAGITTPPAASARLLIVSQELPSGRVGQPYVSTSTVEPVVTLKASGGTTPYTWAIIAGIGGTPNAIGNSGLTLNPSTGAVTGIPTSSGTFIATFRVTDSDGATDQRDFALAIAPALGTPSLTIVSQPNPCTVLGPSCALVGQIMVPAVSVKAFDAAGAVLPGLNVTLSIGTSPVGAILGGTLTRTTNASGVAVFNDLALDRPGTYTLTANASGFAPVSTGAFNVFGADLIVESMTHSPTSPTTADTITFTAVVRNIGSTPAPASTLMFGIGGETPGLPATLIPVPVLAPGATFTAQRQLQLNVAQGYQNTATADYVNIVPENNEANNSATDNFIVSATGITVHVSDPAEGGPSDLTAGDVTLTATDVQFAITYANRTNDSLALIVVDTDANPATGHPGIDSSGTIDDTVIGAEYILMLDARPTAVATVFEHAGGINNFVIVGTLPLTVTPTGYTVVVPRALLGGLAQSFTYKAISQDHLTDFSFTSIEDVMTDVGLPPASVPVDLP